VNIKPIETRYAGHRFRSRLEARWAVFFDALGIAWEYEPQGYMITSPDGQQTRAYLPDFRLPGLDVWAEVKGDPAGVDWALWGCAVDAASMSGLPDSHRAHSGLERPGSAILVLGSIPPVSRRAWLHPLVVNHKGVYIEQVAFGVSPTTFGLDVRVMRGVFDATWDGLDGQVVWAGGPADHSGEPSSGTFKEPMPAVVAAAYDAARTARFEHGEAR
jgi:hypothetical protein